MKKDEIAILKKIKELPDFDDDDIKRLQKQFERDDVVKSLKQIMKKYDYSIDELKELLEEID